MRLYKSYSFKDKDPAIDELRTIKADSGMSDAEISEASGVATSTLQGWWTGDTCRPQTTTMEAAGRAMNHKRVWVKMKANGKGKKK